MEFEINAVLVIEVLGRPPEHIASALSELIERLGKEQDIKVTNKKIYPPKQAEKSESMFIAFAEVELNAKDLARLAELCFAYMPSSIEIVKPYDLKMTLNDANAILNLLLGRLHNYDAIAKRMIIENTILQNQLKQAGIIKQQIPQQQEQKSTKKQKSKPKKAKHAKTKSMKRKK